METGSVIPKAYNPAEVEQRTYAFWTQRDYFSPKGDPEKSAFVIIMPPPNVTGELHLGHAIMDACEDILTRWHRMLGEPTLWLPGVDHAGIATQWVVEQQLAQEGLSRHQLGRERFLERVWEWVERHRHLIFEQHQRLGISADWSRLRFTMDPGPSRAVRLTFVNLYRKGLIYRGERIINWCPRCSTALSDLEVTHEETEGRLYYIRYPLESGGHLTVATTRPETMVGDTAVAVNPEDRRYRGLVGQQAILPIIGRGLPVIADVAVDPQFGTGSLKVTPGHDPVDFEIGQRHNLEVVMAIDQQGRMTEAAGPYQGQDRFEARKGIVAQLQREGLLEKEEPYRHAVGRCQRCRTVVEPLVSKQWFISMKPLAEPAIQAVVEGTVSIVPQRFTRVYLNWMENIRDWCISRQLWWGHRIPVWYCQQCGQETVEVDDPSRCTHCRSPQIEQDPDVLDTWFSSALWPHSTLGWEWGPKDIPPGQEQDLARFYPTVAMETGYDILFFWVARMVMMGLQNTGQVPFRYVYLHGLIRDVHGVKMSKTKGNVLDPVQLIEWYGADALRFALTTGTAPGNDLRLGESKLEAARNFANKLWNAARYVMTTLEGADPASLRGWHHLGPLSHREDRWIVSRLNRVIPAVSRYLEGFQLGEAQRELYEFLWGEFCDWYIEMSKVRLRTGQGPSPLLVLAHVLERTLRLLHPFMPFITEEVWQQLVRRLPREGELPESIMVAPYPQADAARLEPQAEEELSLLIQIVKAIRNARAQLRIPLGQRIQALVNAGDARALVEEASEAIKVLARVEPLRLVDSMDAGVSPDRAVTLLVGPLVVLLPLEGLVDLAAERQRLESELAECDTAIARVEALLAKPGFRQRAPDEVVEREEERLRSLQERRERIREFLNRVAR